MRTPQTLKSWASWSFLFNDLGHAELPHYCLAVNLVTMSYKLQPEFTWFCSKLCSHKPMCGISMPVCESTWGRGAELPLHCSLHTGVLLALYCAGVNALGRGVRKTKQELSALQAASTSFMCTYTAAIITKARREAVQEIMKSHSVYREWKFSTDVGVFFCIH